MQSNAVLEPLSNFGSVWTGEFESLKRAPNGVFFFTGANVDTREILGALRRFQLREMHDVNGAFAFAREPFQSLGDLPR